MKDNDQEKIEIGKKKKITEEIKTKICSKCGLTKIVEEFYLDRRSSRPANSLRPRCKECSFIDRKHSSEYQKRYNKVYYNNNKQKLVNEYKSYYNANKDKINQYVREYHRDRKINNTEQEILLRTKSRAKKYGLPFNLSKDDIIIPIRCPVLDIEIICGPNDGKKGARQNSPSIDRIDPNLGYISGNVRIISHRANTLKNNASIEEIELVLKDLYHLKNKQRDKAKDHRRNQD